jgi:hypothetical protein
MDLFVRPAQVHVNILLLPMGLGVDKSGKFTAYSHIIAIAIAIAHSLGVLSAILDNAVWILGLFFTCISHFTSLCIFYPCLYLNLPPASTTAVLCPGTCIRISVTVFQVRPPGAFYKYFYNHAHRLRLEKLL